MYKDHRIQSVCFVLSNREYKCHLCLLYGYSCILAEGMCRGVSWRWSKRCKGHLYFKNTFHSFKHRFKYRTDLNNGFGFSSKYYSCTETNIVTSIRRVFVSSSSKTIYFPEAIQSGIHQMKEYSRTWTNHYVITGLPHHTIRKCYTLYTVMLLGIVFVPDYL